MTRAAWPILRRPRRTDASRRSGEEAGLNACVAEKLREMGLVLEQQGDDPFRSRAYLRAADDISRLPRPVEDILSKEGVAGLEALPGIGPGIAHAVSELVETGRWAKLERLTGGPQPEILFQSLPGIGEKLAGRLHHDLHIETLEQLAQAARAGRPARIAGLGPRRRARIEAALQARTVGVRQSLPPPRGRPSVGVILDIDSEYLRLAAEGRLPKLAPKRFNPEGVAWLPVLHAQHEPWSFTALFSNTRLAHDLGRTSDWVVIYAHRDGEAETQCTVVTEVRGPLAGRRVVRGREGECIAHYAEAGGAAQHPSARFEANKGRSPGG